MRTVQRWFCLIATVGLAFSINAADVLFYGWGKGKNFQQTGTSTTVTDSVDPWEVTSFAWLNPASGGLNLAYFGTAASPTLYPMSNDGDRWQLSDSASSQAAIDAVVPNGTYRITMQTVHDGTKAADLTLNGNNYPNTPLATNYTAMQAVNPAANFTVYWNAFTGGTTNDVIIASLVANQFAPYGSITNSPYPGLSGALDGTKRAWTIPTGVLTANSTFYVRVVFYKAVNTNKTAYAGVTGYAVYGTGTTIPLVTTSPLPPPPLIITSPTNQTVYVGSNILMAVGASGTGLGYQWRRSGTNLIGATAAVYSIPNAQTNHSGSYAVVVTNAGGSVTSSVATLTVILPPAPTISQQPTNLTVSVGGQASFSVIATGFNLTYQWRRGGTNLSGATASSYSLSDVQLSDAASYTVLVANAGGSITSDPVLLTVLRPTIGPGSLDPTFNPGSGANSWINVILAQSDGKLLIGGLFTAFNGTNRPYVARLNWDGSLDTTFNPGTGPNNALVGLALQPDGKVLIGGFFTSESGQSFRYVARLLPTGSLDTGFATGTNLNNTVKTVVAQADGKVLIGGDFTAYNITPRNRLARLNADGSLDTSFNPGTGADATVNAIVVQADGKILIGGNFSTINGTTRASIARLNANGSLDTSFNPGAGALFWVNSIALQPDAKLVVGGPFTSYNGTSRKGIARLNSDGSLDATFNPGTGANDWVNSVAIAQDDKVVIGGIFTNLNGITQNHLARVGTTGAGDSGFNIGTGFNDAIQSVVTPADGTIVVGGLFTSFNGTPINRIARLIGLTGSPFPLLNLSVGGTSAVFSWPLGLAAFQLQTSPALDAVFTNVPVTLTTNGSYLTTTLSLNQNQRFFRLAKP
jgi:uncharacterized delta-60 repeat protein